MVSFNLNHYISGCVFEEVVLLENDHHLQQVFRQECPDLAPSIIKSERFLGSSVLTGKKNPHSMMLFVL